MRKLLKKLRSRRGETFIEILCAVLIAAFGTTIIVTMLTTAMQLNKVAKQNDSDYYSSVTEMEQMTEKKGAVEVEIADADDPEGEGGKVTVTTDRYGDGEYSSYRKGDGNA